MTDGFGYRATKRALDIVVAAAATAVSSPLWGVIAVAIRLSSRGPILYRATRAGRGGKPFVMYKFRTMHSGAAARSRITAAADVRVFPVGRLLRRLKLDELPQLLNVVRGDMSLVGPRPEDATIVAQHYTDWMRLTLDVAPGMTSPGALHGTLLGDERIGAEDPEADYLHAVLPIKLALELNYVRSRSLRGDLALIGRTVLLIAGRRVAEAERRELAAAEALLRRCSEEGLP